MWSLFQPKDAATAEREGNIVALLEFMRGTDEQQSMDAARALCYVDINGENCVPAIEPLVGFVRSGTDEQKTCAAGALRNLAASNAENKVAIAREGGIAPLIELLSSGTDEQKVTAVDALASLALNAENEVAIAQEGGIAPLVALARSGTKKLQEEAAVALWALSNNPDNELAIARLGGIRPLVALVHRGTDKQKVSAVDALASLALNADNDATVKSIGFNFFDAMGVKMVPVLPGTPGIDDPNQVDYTKLGDVLRDPERIAEHEAAAARARESSVEYEARDGQLPPVTEEDVREAELGWTSPRASSDSD